MTCIVGLITDSGEIIVGADSQLTGDDGEKCATQDRKVFIKNNIVFGDCGGLRAGNLIKHRFEPPTQARNQDAEAFIHKKFLPELEKFFKDLGMTSLPDYGVLIGLGKRIFVMEEDFGIMECSRYGAIGSGAPYALGSLHTTKAMVDGMKRVTLALEAAAQCSANVGKPFHFERLPAPAKERKPASRKRAAKK